VKVCKEFLLYILCVLLLGGVVKLQYAFSLLIVPVALSHCKPSETLEVPEMPSDAPKEMDLSDDGKEIQLKVGQEFSVSLPENRSSGYQWQFDTSELIHVKSDSYISDTSQVGAGGVREFVLTAETEGETTLKAEYLRPWEKGTKPAQTFEMNVLIE
jgi:predicted secreted protein